MKKHIFFFILCVLSNSLNASFATAAAAGRTVDAEKGGTGTFPKKSAKKTNIDIDYAVDHFKMNNIDRLPKDKKSRLEAINDFLEEIDEEQENLLANPHATNAQKEETVIVFLRVKALLEAEKLIAQSSAETDNTKKAKSSKRTEKNLTLQKMIDDEPTKKEKLAKINELLEGYRKAADFWTATTDYPATIKEQALQQNVKARTALNAIKLLVESQPD